MFSEKNLRITLQKEVFLEEISYLIKNIADKLKISTEKELKKYDLTLSQSRVLLYLDSRGGEAMQKEIQSFLKVTHPTVIGLINRLERKGFVRTWINIKNKKEVVVSLTERSVFVVEDMERVRNEREFLLKEGMTKKETEIFTKILQKVQQNINNSIEANKDVEDKITKKEEEEDSVLWFW